MQLVVCVHSPLACARLTFHFLVHGVATSVCFISFLDPPETRHDTRKVLEVDLFPQHCWIRTACTEQETKERRNMHLTNMHYDHCCYYCYHYYYHLLILFPMHANVFIDTNCHSSHTAITQSFLASVI